MMELRKLLSLLLELILAYKAQMDDILHSPCQFPTKLQYPIIGTTGSHF